MKNAELAKDAVTAPKVANGSLRSEDFAAGQLPAGAQGPQGVPGSALAFARVFADGTLDAANSSNVQVVPKTTGFGGFYCLNVTASMTPRNAVATIDVGGADSTTDIVSLTLTPSAVSANCQAGADVVVTTGRTTQVGAHTSLPFYIVFN